MRELPNVSGAPLGEDILDECLGIAEMLIEKNRAYGNSALQPVRVFSKASSEEQLLVRIDDKFEYQAEQFVARARVPLLKKDAKLQ